MREVCITFHLLFSNGLFIEEDLVLRQNKGNHSPNEETTTSVHQRTERKKQDSRVAARSKIKHSRRRNNLSNCSFQVVTSSTLVRSFQMPKTSLDARGFESSSIQTDFPTLPMNKNHAR